MPDPASSPLRYNTRLGLILFALYLVLYLGFVLINAIRAEWMERKVLAGLNLAIVYGFGLILAALILSLIYGALCRTSSVGSASDDESSEPRSGASS